MIHPLSRLTPKHLAPSLIALLLGCPALAMPAHAGWLFGGDGDAPKQSSANNAKDTPKMAPATDIEGNVRQARMLRQAGNYQEAIHHLSQLMLVASDNGQVVGEYGKTLAQMGRAQDAVHFLTRAEQLAPDDWTIASALGVAYDELGDQNNAQAAYGRALKLKPDEPSVLNNYALSRLLAHDPQKARELAERARAAGGAADPKIERNLAMIDNMVPAPQGGNAKIDSQDSKNSLAQSEPAPAKAAPATPVKTAQAATPAPTRDGTAYAVSSLNPARPFVTIPASPRISSAPASAPAPTSGKIDIAAAPAPVQPRGVVMQKVPVDPLAGPVAGPVAREATHKPHALAAKAPAAPPPAGDPKPAAKMAKAVSPKPAPAARNIAESTADKKTDDKKTATNKIPALRLSANAY